MRGVTQFTTWALVACLSLLAGAGVQAQVSDVLVSADREYMGLAGQSRPGVWTPIRIELENRSSEPRRVVCRWLLEDADGDRVHAQRRITLDVHRNQPVWLYGPLPVNTRPNQPWIIQILDETQANELTRIEVPPAKMHSVYDRMIGIAGGQDLGLTPYTYETTSHENIHLVEGLSLTTLPDRWFGLSAIDTLIWARNGGDPDDPKFSSDSQQALRQWVRRGGHLVIVLPAVGESWTGSGLSDLLPVKSRQMSRTQGTPPGWLGDIHGAKVISIDMTVFDVEDQAGVDVLLKDGSGRPMVIAKRYGFGRVTLVGIDLADRRLTEMGLPNGRRTLWNDIFRWQTPVYSEAYIQAETDATRMSRADQRTPIPLGRFIPGSISMRGAAAPALLASVLVFGLYWFAAGPISFISMKKRKALRHSWVVFVMVVLGFSVISWAGAWLIAPKTMAVSHFTVLDAEAHSKTVHAHSWFSLFVPEFGDKKVEIDPDHPQTRNTLASPGMLNRRDDGFLDPQTYVLDSGSPNHVNIPFRATAKQLEADFFGRIDKSSTGLEDPWILPQGGLEIQNFWPNGQLSHGLPGPLRDVLLVFCPGGNQMPWVWRLDDAWEPQQVLELNKRSNAERLVIPTRNYHKRQWPSEGFLGKLIKLKPGRQYIDLATGDEVTTSSSEMIQFIQLLCFYDTLPPPDFRKIGLPYAASYKRALGRQLDLTPMLTGPRLIVIGHLEDSPMPLPVTVSGEYVPSTGWTVVRWVYDFK